MGDDRCCARRVGRAGGRIAELHRHHQPRPAHIRDRRVLVGQALQPRTELIAAGVDRVQESGLGEHLDRCDRSSATDRVAAVRAAVRSDGPARHQLGRRSDRSDREARRDALGHHDDVGLHVALFDREHGAGACEAGLHLVRDEQDAVLRADRRDLFEEAGGRLQVPALAEHRLDDRRCGLGRGGLAGEQVAETRDGLVDRLVHRPVGADRVRERRHEHTRGQRRVTRPVPGLGRGHRHRHVGASVEAPLEHDDVRPARCLLGELDRALGRLGTGVREEERVDGSRCEFGQAFGERLEQVVAVAVDLRVDEAAGLFTDGLDDVRVAVTGRDDGDAAGEVQVARAVGGGDPAPLTLDDVQVGDLEPHGCEVCTHLSSCSVKVSERLGPRGWAEPDGDAGWSTE